MALRNLILVLGDQLDLASSAFDGFDPEQDAVWMAEVREESDHVPSHRARTVMFLSAMRHFAAAIAARGWTCHYVRLEDRANTQTLAGELRRAAHLLGPAKVILAEPGDWRVWQSLRGCAKAEGIPLEIRPDRHFYCGVEWFREWAKQRKQLRLEFFYREMRRIHGVLMDGNEPEGGQWNFDASNREPFGKQGPTNVPPPRRFEPDAITREVIRTVEERFPDHPGSTANFDFPVTAQQAEEALAGFVADQLPWFGRYQDAMWSGEPWLYHSRISAALNLKLLSPRRAVEAAVEAWRRGAAPLESVEGFVRQILGWREYVRGIYWTEMPGYASMNALDAHAPLPKFYWTGDTTMNCLRQVIGQTLESGYAHHIQRLMVTGLYALLLGVTPREVHEWYLAMYVDAVEWVELPNSIGMSQFADGGRMASKPYAATGKYIQRMSNYCGSCRFDPGEATGDRACPFTTLYWDFLLRNEGRLRRVPRMELQLKNLVRITPELRAGIAERAEFLRKRPG